MGITLKTSEYSLQNESPERNDLEVSLVAGDRLLIRSLTGLLALSLPSLDLLWKLDRAPSRRPLNLESQSEEGPNRLWTGDRLLWANSTHAAHLEESEDGLSVTGIDLDNGQLLWKRPITGPPPVPWRELEIGAEGVRTENLSACLMACEPLVLIQSRRYCRMKTVDQTRPPDQRRLEFARLDPASGEILWASVLEGTLIPRLNNDAPSDIYCFDSQLFFLRLDAGEFVQTGPLPPLHSPYTIRIGSRVLAAWHGQGKIGVAEYDYVSGQKVKEAEWSRRGVTEVHLKVAGDVPLLKINEQFIALLGDNLQPLWESKVKPYIYAVAAAPEGPIWVGTSGRGGCLYALNRSDGACELQQSFIGGVHKLIEVPGTKFLAGLAGESLVFVDGVNQSWTEMKQGFGHAIHSNGSCVISVSGTAPTIHAHEIVDEGLTV